MINFSFCLSMPPSIIIVVRRGWRGWHDVRKSQDVRNSQPLRILWPRGSDGHGHEPPSNVSISESEHAYVNIIFHSRFANCPRAEGWSMMILRQNRAVLCSLLSLQIFKASSCMANEDVDWIDSTFRRFTESDPNSKGNTSPNNVYW